MQQQFILVKTGAVVLYIFLSTILYAQDSAVLLVISNIDAKILLDGIEKGTAQKGAAFRIETSFGEHYVEVQSLQQASNQTKGEIVQLEAGKQKILKLDFELTPTSVEHDVLPVAEINFDLPGSVEVLAWQSDNKGQEYAYPSYYFAFEKGDEIILDVSMSNQKGTNIINVSTYPNNVVRYTNNAFVSLQNLSIKVPERSIYRFTLATNHAFPRNCFLKIKRKPGSAVSASFNPNVSLKRIFTPVQLSEPETFFINSGSNATFMGGTSRVVVPVNLPKNTVQWFYRFSASRNKEDVDRVKSNFGLFGELTKLLFGVTGPASNVIDIAVEKLTNPPGANYCTIYLLHPQARQAFESKTEFQYFLEGTRSNFMSGNVKVSDNLSGSYFLGIMNPDTYYGIAVSVEIVAITAKDDYVMENN